MSGSSDSSTWRLSTPSGIPVKVVSREGTFADEAGSATEVYIIKANQLVNFVLESFPSPLVLFGTVFYPARRRMPGLGPFQTVRVQWRGLVEGKPVDPFNTDPNAPENTYQDNIQLTIEYSTGTANDLASGSDPNDPFTFLEITATASGEFLSVPNRGELTWDGEGSESNVEVKERDVPMPIVVSQVEWNVRWTQIPFSFFNGILADRLRSKLGKVNNAPMPLFFNAPEETIMFMGWSLQQQLTWRTGLGGQPPMQLDMKFAEKNFIAPDGIQVTHNHLYRTTSTAAGTFGGAATYPGWRRIIIPGLDGDKFLYDSTNLTQIFAPSP